MSQTFTVPTSKVGGNANPILLGPFAVPPDTTEIDVSSVMAQADILSTSPVYTVDFAVEVAPASGAFAPAGSTHWTSGPDNSILGRPGRGPGLNVPVDPAVTQIRARLTVPVKVSIGATLTTLP